MNTYPHYQYLIALVTAIAIAALTSCDPSEDTGWDSAVELTKDLVGQGDNDKAEPAPVAQTVTNFVADASADAPAAPVVARKKTAGGPRVLALGDSLTAENGAKSWPAQLAGLTGVQVIGAGRGGERQGAGAGRLGGLLAAHDPDIVLWMEGTNDIGAGFSAAGIAANVARAKAACAATGATLVVMTIPPFVKGASSANGAVQAYNAALRSAAAAAGVRVVDVYSAIVGCTSCFDSDGIHLSVSGSFVVAEAASSAVR